MTHEVYLPEIKIMVYPTKIPCNNKLEIIEFLYLVEKFLVEIFQKFFDYNSKSESSKSENSEEEKEDKEDSK